MQLDREWLETDGLGGYATGTVGGVRERRYHALLVAATEPPAGRVVVWSGCDAVVDTASGSFPISTQRYAPDVVHPDGVRRLVAFGSDPWPTWTFALEDGTTIEQQLFMVRGSATTVMTWKLVEPRPGVTLRVRPFLCGRDDHALRREDADGIPAPRVAGQRLTWPATGRAPALMMLANGIYHHDPYWYRSFHYAEERRRGYDADEDLPSPGELTFDLGDGEAVIVAVAGDDPTVAEGKARAVLHRLRSREAVRRGGQTALQRAAESYLVRRGAGLSVIAGYPWFADWGRDTCIAVRGLCLATGRIAEARDVLLQWADAVDAGMLPNRLPDRGGGPEFNSADAALWFVVAAHELLQLAEGTGVVQPRQRRTLREACSAIVEAYASGARYRVGCDRDGLLAAGEAGVQLTWMDARIGDEVVTPRIGKPVELQALWLNALRIASQWDDRWRAGAVRGLASFGERFWNPALGCLFDVVDVDHRPGTHDARVRPNQVFAVGGLPFATLSGARAQSVIRCVEAKLWTPFGLRTLARDEADYRPAYGGDQAARDAAYHQGTVWPWLLGPFVDGWLATGCGSAREARDRFLQPLLRHLDDAGIGHVSEVFDAEPPHAARGSPFQAWSVGELLRIQQLLAADEAVADTPASLTRTATDTP